MPKRSARRTAGDGGLYRRADGTWVATLDLGYGPTGKRRRWTAKSKDKSKVIDKQLRARQEIALYGVVAPKNVTVSQWLDRWLEEIVRPHRRPKTYIGYQSLVRGYLAPAIGQVKLVALTPGHVRRMEDAIASTGRVATARAAHRVLSSALHDAASEGLVVRNVAAMVEKPPSTAQDRTALTVAEAKLVMPHANPAISSRVTVALMLGLRQGEAMGLQWDRVDLQARTVDISWQLQRLPFRHGCGGRCQKSRAGSCPRRVLDVPTGFEHQVLDGGLCLTRPKTAKGRRVIPLPGAVVTALRAHQKASLAAENPHHLVWTRPGGRPLDAAADTQAWATALAAAGVRPVPLHSARHTTATLLLEAGVDGKVIQEILGHTDIETTRGYQHVDLTLARDAMERLGRTLA